MSNQYRSVLESSGPAPTGGNALPADVLSGKTFTNDNGQQTGSMTNRGTVTQSISVGQTYTIPQGYHSGSGTVSATGAQTAEGNFTFSSTDPTTVNVGFEPDFVIVTTSNSSGSPYAQTVFDRSVDANRQLYSSSSNLEWTTLTTANNRFSEITSNGFTIGKTGNGSYTNGHYVAIKF